jgi:hypothetical protein
MLVAQQDDYFEGTIDRINRKCIFAFGTHLITGSHRHTRVETAWVKRLGDYEIPKEILVRLLILCRVFYLLIRTCVCVCVACVHVSH